MARGTDVSALGGWLYVDPLAADFVALIGLIRADHRALCLGLRPSRPRTRRDGPRDTEVFVFFHLFLFTMLLLVVTSNNIVMMMWVAVER